jgi:hypothetical protein
LKAQRAHEPFAFLHQTEKVTTNGDNKNKPPNITDTPHNHILYTSTISQTQTSELDYIIHDNKREHTTAIFTNDKSKQHNQPKPPKTKWRKRIRKTPNKTLNRYFIFLTSEHISTNWTNQHQFRIITKIPRFVNIKCHIVAIIVT